jgi:hypothetical protein
VGEGGYTVTTATTTDLNVAPGSNVVIRDEEWLVTSAEQGADGWLVRVRGLPELVAETTAAFYSSLNTIEVQDPREAKVVADGSSNYRDSRLWLEAMLRKTPSPTATRPSPSRPTCSPTPWPAGRPPSPRPPTPSTFGPAS